MRTLSKSLKRYLVVWLASSMLLIGFLIFTKPLELSLPVLLIPFLLFAVGIRSGAIGLGMWWRKYEKPSRKIRVVGDSLAAVLLLVVTLQSLGQLSWRDLLLVGSLILGLAIYFYKTDLI